MLTKEELDHMCPVMEWKQPTAASLMRPFVIRFACISYPITWSIL